MNRRHVLLSSLVLLVPILLVATTVATTDRNLVTNLSEGEEVPPVGTLAQGQVIFHLNKDGTELSYKLIVANIENVVASHIHLAPAGINGPVVALLYSGAPSGRFDGVLIEGTITSANLVGPLTGQPLSALMDAMMAGNPYVNVHTSQYPGGEIRGQI